MIVTADHVEGLSGFSWLGPILGPLGTAGLVLAMVIFMLLERRDLRDRLIGLFGYGRLTVTTKAFDEAGTRVSRQLLMQSLVNLFYGVAAGIGLYVLGVPYPWVWAALGAHCVSSRTWVPSSAPARRSWSAWLRSRAGLVRCGSSGCSWCSSCSRTSSSKPRCMRGRRESPKWRCWCRSRSGRGCGVRSGCCWPRR